jgi:hypothetical protein
MLNKICFLFALFFSQSCTAGEPVVEAENEFAISSEVKFVKGKKCAEIKLPPITKPCKNSTYFIIRDVNGVPISVADVKSCEGKNVTWTYEPTSIDALGAPKFALLFYPEYPGKTPKTPYSEDFVDGYDKQNQEYTLKTKKLKKSDEPECINYMVIIPTTGILDPVFIIDK